MKVSLLVTCLTDLFSPQVGMATVKVLEHFGCVVDFPEAQTCCGQPQFNNGYPEQVRGLARRMIEVFEASEYVVTPSGSCCAMVREHYPELMKGDGEWEAKAAAFAAKTYELVEFLTKVLKVDVRGLSLPEPTAVTYHFTCHLRGLGETGGGACVELVKQLGNATFVPLEKAEQCCGFGGTFSTKYGDISGSLVRDKVKCGQQTGAAKMIVNDAGCAMNIGGGCRRQGAGFEVTHIAELLAAAIEGERESRRMTVTTKTARRCALPVFNSDFPAAAKAAAADEALHAAMDNACVKKDAGRRELLKTELADADGLRALAGRIKEHALAHLDYYLEQLEGNVVKNGGHVHWAATAEEANELIVEIARQHDCKLVVKSKSMVSEETELNKALAAAGLEAVETDLGELIVQVAGRHPSHLVMPAMDLRAREVGEIFAKFFGVAVTEDPAALAEMSRVYLRERFNRADMGISGVNFAVAETGSICLCTNEGNGRMCTSRPRVHVALMGMEKVVPRLGDLAVFLKLLTRSATTQSLTQYTSIITGPRRPGELDGPEEFHLVIMDNGRGRILASDYRDTLRCIRCGGCLNACPVFRTVGGHTYGSVYSGPIGALLTPLFNGLEGHEHLPQATSLCGACYEACPVKINIPEMLIGMKGDLKRAGKTPWYERATFWLWTVALSSRAGYEMGQKLQQVVLRRMLGGKGGWIRRMPGPAKGWTDSRDFPQPAAKTFRTQWRQRKQSGGGR